MGLQVIWNEEDVKYPRFSTAAHLKHFKEQNEILETFRQGNRDKFERKSELIKKYVDYGKIVKP
jgi:hypothetical protein